MSFWKSATPQPTPQNKRGMFVGLNQENKIDIICDWPEIKTREEADTFAKEYALMIINVFKKEILPYIQTTIISHGVKTGNERLSNIIVVYINSLLNPEVVDDNAPVITPDNAFQIRGGN